MAGSSESLDQAWSQGRWHSVNRNKEEGSPQMMVLLLFFLTLEAKEELILIFRSWHIIIIALDKGSLLL